jgi:hypothetical protein
MRHPNQAVLALHAGGDLGSFARWKTERHLTKCPLCRDEVDSFRGVREAVSELSDLPDIAWGRMRAEIQANVRLGLAAGECVRSEAPLASGWFTGARATVTFASVLALMAAGLILEKPQPSTARFGPPVIEATANGIQLSGGGQMVGLMNRHGVQNVNYSVSAEGSVEASYVDSKGYMTVNSIYGQ